MPCSLAGGVQVHFKTSGIILEVYDLTTRENNRRYAHAKVQVTKKAGQLLAANATHKEPVEVYIAGARQNRYYYPSETLEIGNDAAWFKLYDARKILDSGIISQHFNEVEVGEVVEYIFTQRDDPHNVITGWDAVTPELLEQSKQDTQEIIAELIGGEDADASRGNLINPFYSLADGDPNSFGFVNWDVALSSAAATVANAVGALGQDDGLPYNKFRGLEFDDVSPNQALATVGDMFAFSSWVEPDGTLWIGQRELIPTNRHAVSGHPRDDRYALKEYNITEGAAEVTLVRLNGKSILVDPGISDTDQLYPIAEAWVEDGSGAVADGTTLAPDENCDIWELASLETAARNRLIQKSMNYRNGNIVLNGAASTEQAKLAAMDIGDILMVADYIGGRCGSDIDGGAYVVTEVQHKVNARQGWTVTVKVGTVPDNIQSMSVYYNASDDKGYTDLNSYREDQ